MNTCYPSSLGGILCNWFNVDASASLLMSGDTSTSISSGIFGVLNLLLLLEDPSRGGFTSARFNGVRDRVSTCPTLLSFASKPVLLTHLCTRFLSIDLYVGSSLTWNWDEACPVSLFNIRDTFLPYEGDLPK